MKGPVLCVKDLSLSFGRDEIIHQVSFSLSRGVFVGILGPNGSGKTTLIKGLSRILQPENGFIHLLGRELQTYTNREFAQHISLVSQENAIKFDFSVREVVLMGRNPYIRRFHPATFHDREICNRALQTVGIENLADRIVTQISGGERQRVLIARALAQEPDLLLLDEATSHLDINHENEILSVIRQKVTNEMMTVLGVFHNLNSASFFCDHLIILQNGSIAVEGTPKDVLNSRTIQEIFGLPVFIQPHPVNEKPVVIPFHHTKERVHRSLSIHLVCGGGTGSLLMNILASEGYTITCGILSHGDQDIRCADLYHHASLVGEPFQPVSKELIDELRRFVALADAVIVTKMPIGDGNLANLSVLLELDKTRVIFFDPDPGPFSFNGYDFTSGNAESIIKTLCMKGAIVVHSVANLLVCLADLEETIPVVSV